MRTRDTNRYNRHGLAAYSRVSRVYNPRDSKMRRGDMVVGMDALEEWVVPRERQTPLKWLQRRWNRLSRLQKTLFYGVLLVSILASLHFYLNRDVQVAPIPDGKLGRVPDGADDEEKPRVFPEAEKDPDLELEDRLVFTGPTNERQAAVVEAFRHAWRGYRKLAWGHDNLRPISGTASDWFALGLTIIDSMDTAYIMGLNEEYEEARKWVRDELVFDRNKDVNFFEVTIRVLGALLTNYHFTRDRMFLDKARDLGSRLMAAYASPSGVPYSDVNLGARTAHAPEWSHYSTTAEVATVQLEFRELSRLTGDPSYEQAAAAVSERLHYLQKKHGLVPIFISPSSGRFLPHAAITLGARGDSYYEYLLKQWLQTGKSVNYFLDDYQTAVEGMKEALVRHSSPSNLLFIGELAAGSEAFTAKMDHLTCFLPGTLALGHAHGMPGWHLALAEQLINTCYQTYAQQPTFLAPEITHFNMAGSGATEDMYVKNADSHSLLRPEFVESLWYLYQLTGNTTYQQWGWQVFQAIEKHARVENGYASLADVRNAENPGHRDSMETFFLAETLKYLYLLMADDRYLIDLSQYVFNTEAHPLPVRDH